MTDNTYCGAWVSDRCAAELKELFGITKKLHLTLYYNAIGGLDLVTPIDLTGYTVDGLLYGTVTTVHEQQVGNTRLLIAELDTPWSYQMNEYFVKCVGPEVLPHRAHITLAKNIQPGYSMAFSGLIGRRIEFDRIGVEE